MWNIRYNYAVYSFSLIRNMGQRCDIFKNEEKLHKIGRWLGEEDSPKIENVEALEAPVQS